VLQCVAVCCSVLQCVAVGCSVLQCVVRHIPSHESAYPLALSVTAGRVQEEGQKCVEFTGK